MANAYTNSQAVVRRRIKSCKKCNLHTVCSAPVPIQFGGKKTPYLVIGEGPGYSEDKRGIPFVGKSGQYLREVIKNAGINTKLVSYCNLVSCRPPDNRNPHKSEVTACSGNLRMQLSIAKPTVVFLLGAQVLNHFRPDMSVTWDRGRPFVDYDKTRIFIPTFHPAFILRTKKVAPNFEDDIKQGYYRFKRFVKGGLLSACDPWPEDCHRPNCSLDVDKYDKQGVAFCKYHWSGGEIRKVEEMVLDGVV